MKKAGIFLIILSVLTLVLCVCAAAESASKTLVAVFSATGNTRSVAEQIASLTGADLYEIVPAEPYSASDLNYNDNDSRANREQYSRDTRPEMTGIVENFDQYDTVFLGYPIWWGGAPRIMLTFAESHDFTGKTVIPFCTSGGSAIGSSASEIEECAGAGEWLAGRRFSGSATEQEIADWLASLDLPAGNE